MKKISYKVSFYVCLALMLITLCAAVIFLFNGQSAVLALAAERNAGYGIMEDGDFEEGSIIVVLNSESSKFRGISSSLVNKLSDIGGKSIDDLSELPTQYVNEDGTINYSAAPSLATYYENNPFKQILYVTLQEKSKRSVIDAVAKVEKFPEVYYVGPNWVEAIGEFVPNDTYYSDQLSLKPGDGIDVENAWDITRGMSTVRVGIIDSGIATHNDLDAHVQTGYDYYNKNSITNDPLGGHGTHVAGIIGAIGNNSLGISGVAPNVTLVPLQTAYDSSGHHYVSTRVEAIKDAIELWEDENQRISILNHSISGFGTRTEIAAAVANFPGLFVWSAGNDREDTDKMSEIDKFNLPNVISVGSIDFNGKRSEFSNYGEKAVDIYAPGENILSTFPPDICATGKCEANNGGTHIADGYHFMSGTSMAAPHVTGVAALLLSKNPALNAAQLKKAILDNADEIEISVPSSSDPQKVKKLNAYEALKSVCYKVTFDKQGGYGGDDFVYATYGEKMPAATAPTREGYEFLGYYTKNDIMYYDVNMKSVGVWDIEKDTTLYAKWDGYEYTVTFKILGDTTGEYTFTSKVKNGANWPKINMPIRQGYYVGQYKDVVSNRTYYYYFDYGIPHYDTVNLTGDLELIGSWIENTYNIVISYKHEYAYASRISAYPAGHSETLTFTADESMTYGGYTRLFSKWSVILDGEAYYDPINNPWYTISTERTITVNLAELVKTHYPNLQDNAIIEFRAEFATEEKSCVAEGTLITLANGEQVPVEQLTGDEMLLVWNLFTGTFDTAPILFIDSDPPEIYQVINLYFSDGTQVKVISEHAFWDFDLNRYVYLDKDASEYIGHWFNKQSASENGEFYWTSVQLTDVIIQEEYTAAYSPVTYGHLCYYVDGMLSMPGGIGGLFNIFEVDANTMSYDAESMQNDIEQYGLFTYEEFYEILPVARELFEAVNGQYLKVAIGKGLIDLNTIASYINKYSALLG